MRIIETFNKDWTFHAGFEPGFASASQQGETVQLPHTAVELPYNYFDEKSYQKAFTYQKIVAWDPRFEGREVSLVFDAAMADSVVYLNDIEITAHKDGYTPFEARLTPHLKAGDNLLTVKIDGSENPEIPPFGGVIDYLTYAGIYRDVWLKITAPVSIKNVKIETPDVLGEAKQATAKVWISNPTDQALSGKVTAVLKDGAGQEIARTEATVSGAEVSLSLSGLQGITLWDIDNPALYHLSVTLETAADDEPFRLPLGGIHDRGLQAEWPCGEAEGPQPSPGLAASRLCHGSARSGEGCRHPEIRPRLQHSPNLALSAVEILSRSLRRDRSAGLRRDPRLAAYRR